MHSRVLHLIVACSLHALSVLAADPITGTWRFFDGSTREMRADGSSGPPGGGSDAQWKCLTPQSNFNRIYQIIYGGGVATDRLTLTNGNNELHGTLKGRPFPTASRTQATPPSASQSAPTPRPAPAPAAPRESGGDALLNVLLAHEWTWRDTAPGGSKGTLIFTKEGLIKHLDTALLPWTWSREPGEAITIKAGDVGVLAKFNGERSEFIADFPGGTRQLRGLRGKLIGSSSPGKSPIVQPVGAGADSTGYGGMVLGTDWQPRSTDVKVKELEELEFFAKMAVGNAAPGKEPVPQMIVPPFKWLMPLQQAEALLPRGVAAVPVKPFQNDGFPQGSLTIKCFQFRYFSDLDESFNLIYFITDRKLQLVGVQFKSQAKPLHILRDFSIETLRGMHPPFGPPGAPPPWDGNIGPYNDFINEGRPGAFYQVRQSNDKSMTLIKLGNTHLYLAAPFARCLLDIADKHRKSGLIK